MLYQLVLITNLGVVTPLATFPTQQECMRERVLISQTQQYSTACLPTESPEQLQKRIEKNMTLMINTINNISQGVK